MKGAFLRKAATRVGRGLQRLGRWALALGRWLGRLWGRRALGWEIQDLQQRRREQFLRIGEQVYRLYQKHLVQNPDIIALCEEVRALEALMEEKQKKEEAIAEVPLERENAVHP